VVVVGGKGVGTLRVTWLGSIPGWGGGEDDRGKGCCGMGEMEVGLIKGATGTALTGGVMTAGICRDTGGGGAGGGATGGLTIGSPMMVRLATCFAIFSVNATGADGWGGAGGRPKVPPADGRAPGIRDGRGAPKEGWFGGAGLVDGGGTAEGRGAGRAFQAEGGGGDGARSMTISL
jgi:hypothetical protein